MARPKGTTKSTVDNKATTEIYSVVADLKSVEESENMNNKKESKKAEVPLNDSDDIEIISLVPNVSYYDKATGDTYIWEYANHSEYMTYSSIKTMWRNHKGYFRNMLLRPNDERVLKELNLNKLYEKIDFLMDESNYVKENINIIFETLNSSSNEIKFTVCNIVKNGVVNGSISDVAIIRRFEREFDLDLISLL